MRCNYPDCDGGPASGYCHTDCRIVPCEACGTEGRIYAGHSNDPNPRDDGPCPACEGTGSEIVETQPIELEDLDAAAVAALANEICAKAKGLPK